MEAVVQDRCRLLSAHLWGKSDPYESIYSHSHKVASAMEVLAEYVPEKYDIISELLEISHEEAVRLSCYLAGIHDIGKIVPVWQGQPGAPEQDRRFLEEHSELFDRSDSVLYKGYRHERGSYHILFRIWKSIGLFGDRRKRTNLAAVVLTHHQKNADLSKDNVPGTVKSRCDGVCAPEWMQCQEELEGYYRNRYSVDDIEICGDDMDVPCMIMSGLLILADWMGSSLGKAPCESSEEKRQFVDIIRSFVDHMKLRVESSIPGSFQSMWPWIQEMRPLQNTVVELMDTSVPLLTIIEDSMGAGKTEAALYVANRLLTATGKSGLFIALPTSATANQMHQRVDELLDRNNMKGARLLHGTAWLSAPIDSDNISDAESFLSPMRMGLLAPYGVGTIDQALMTILKMKYGNLRMSGICDKVIIVDEVHAYDAYMTRELHIFLQWCKEMHVPVILLSATLPEEKRREFVSIFSDHTLAETGYPRVTAVDENGVLIEKRVAGSENSKTYDISAKPILNQAEEIADLALDKVREGGTLCVNVNTVQRAIEITKLLDAQAEDVDIYIFHSRYSMARRKEIEENCVRLFGKDTGNRPRKAILVATQVVEQSLDIDFDYYITDLCPIDLVLQRIGRQFRHEGTKRPCDYPEATILVPDEGEGYGASELVYDRYLLDTTKRIIEVINEITVPADIQSLVDSVYGAVPSENCEIESYYDMVVKNDVKENATEVTALKPPGRYFQFGKAMKEGILFENETKTRLAEPTVRIAILPEDLYNKVLKGNADREEQKLAYEYSFSVMEGKYSCDHLPKGERMLKDVFLLKGQSGSYGPSETAWADGIRMDSRYGVIIKKGKDYV